MSAIATAWVCEPCEVGGTDVDPEPACWNCAGPVLMTARPVATELCARTAASSSSERVAPW